MHVRIIASERSIERSSDRASDRAIERSSNRAIERAIDRAIERSSEWLGDRAIERAIEWSSDQNKLIITRAPEVLLTIWLASFAAFFKTHLSKTSLMLKYTKNKLSMLKNKLPDHVLGRFLHQSTWQKRDYFNGTIRIARKNPDLI